MVKVMSLDSASESSASEEQPSQEESTEQNTWDEDDGDSSSDGEVLAKKRKAPSKKDEREMVMRVIQENPEDFGVRRSGRAPIRQRTLSDSDGSEDDESNASSDEDIVIPRKRQ